MKFQFNDGWYREVEVKSNVTLTLEGSLVFTIDSSLNALTDDYILQTDLPTLYKKDAKGRWQELRVDLRITGGTPHIYRVIKTKGLKDKEYLTIIKVVKSKYLSDTIQERLQSVWNKKRDRDLWRETQEEAVLKEPMRLDYWNDYADRIKYPAIIMPKLNGVKATYKHSHGLLSRTCKPFDKLPHISNELMRLFCTVEGELWAPGKKLEDIVSLATGGDEKRELGFYIFNKMSGSGGFASRMKNLISVYEGMSLEHVHIIPMAVVNSKEEAEAAFKVLKDMDGYDGAVIANADSVYEWDKRSKDVLKMKDIISMEFKLVGFTSDSDPISPLIAFHFELEDDITFKVTPNWDKEKRRAEYLKCMQGTHFLDYYKNTLWTIEFREYTKKGIPRHILGITRRDYE